MAFTPTLNLADADVSFDHVRADDGEVVGYLAISPDDRFIPYDLLQRQQGDAMELEEAEETLNRIGLTLLSRTWTYPVDGVPRRCRIVELTRDSVVISPVLGDLDPGDADSTDLTAKTELALPAPELVEADPA